VEVQDEEVQVEVVQAAVEVMMVQDEEEETAEVMATVPAKEMEMATVLVMEMATVSEKVMTTVLVMEMAKMMIRTAKARTATADSINGTIMPMVKRLVKPNLLSTINSETVGSRTVDFHLVYAILNFAPTMMIPASLTPSIFQIFSLILSGM